MSAARVEMAYCHECRGEVPVNAGCCSLCGVELLDIRLDELPEIGEYVVPGPFLAWAVEKRGQLVREARERGERIPNNDQGLKRLLNLIGLKPEYWQHLTHRRVTLPAAEVALYLERAGARFEDLYGPEDHVDAWAHRRSPRKRVKLMRVTPEPTPGADGWQPIDRPDDRYKPTNAIPRKHTGRDTYLDEEQLRFAGDAYLAIPTIRFAAQELERRYGLCGYTASGGLYQAVQKAFKRRGWTNHPEKLRADLAAGRIEKKRGEPRPRTRLPEWLIWEAAYRYYWDQWGFQRMGRYFHVLVPNLYRRPQNLETALYAEFKRRGWPRRDRIQATRIASFKHGLAARNRYQRPRDEGEGPYRAWLRHRNGEARPRCPGTVTQGARKGKRCLRAAALGSEYCPQHDPAKRERQLEQVVRMRELMHGSEVPTEPFAVWLERQLAAWPDTKAMCQAMSERGYGKVMSLHAMCRHVVKRENPRVRRETVEKFLEALADCPSPTREVRNETVESLVESLGPGAAEQVVSLLGEEPTTFEDLYGPYVRGEQ